MLKQIAAAATFTIIVCGFMIAARAETTNGNNGWGNGGGDGTTAGSANGKGFGMTIDDHGNTRFHGVEGGTKSSSAWPR